MPKFKPKKGKPKIEEVTKEFGEAHAQKEAAEVVMKKNRSLFFNLIEIPETQLARQTIYPECDDPVAYVASLYPKWIIVSQELVNERIPDEWRLVIQEDPKKKSYTYINPLDGRVYTRTVAESAPGIDLERLRSENPILYQSITIEPPKPERVLKPLSELAEDEKDELKKYLTPVKLTDRMEKPRDPKPEELE